MKKALCLLIVALLLLGCAPARALSAAPEPGASQKPEAPAERIESCQDFSLALAARLVDGSKNSSLSPVSVYFALAMAAEGARGETQRALLQVLGAKSIEDLRARCNEMLEALSREDEESVLAFADAFWVDDKRGRLTFREEYLQALSEIYRAEAGTADFADPAAGAIVAAWIREKTRGKIDISPDAMKFSPETAAVLVNTVYLKDAWEKGFEAYLTAPGTFFGPQGETTVSYMQRTDREAVIARGDGFTRYSLPLKKVGQMTFVLPDEGVALSDLLGTAEGLDALLHGGEGMLAHVRVKLPKFSFQDRYDLEAALTALGGGIAFSWDADFSGMGDFHARISRALQESYMAVDEGGVEAAAYTMVEINTRGMLPQQLPEAEFFLTRPFLYAVESWDGTLLFVGTVIAPDGAE